jgi:menaquinone-dependent protoporphyrinogen oxidase
MLNMNHGSVMKSVHVLVAYATRSGSTAEIARAIANELTMLGLDSTVLSADQAGDVRKYDAIILGSAVYVWRWEKSALEFAENNLAELRHKPVWLFSSGPLDFSAEKEGIKPVRAVRRISKLIGARGHVTFGGKLPPETKGFLAKQSPRAGSEGDFRNFGQIREWANHVGMEIVSRHKHETVIAR